MELSAFGLRVLIFKKLDFKYELVSSLNNAQEKTFWRA
jgi:hypothetical protein